MDNRFKIAYKRRTQTGWLMWLILMLPFFFAFLVELLGLPYMVRYSVDVVWVLAFFYILFVQRKKHTPITGNLGKVATAFFIYTALVYIVQFQSPLYYLWGVRCNFRFFVAFFAFALFLKTEDVAYYFKALDIFFWINIAVSLVQYFGLGLVQDNLGGIFGSVTGVNGYTTIFFSIVLTKSILNYLEKKESLQMLLLKSAAALLVAALAELKFFFFFFAMIVMLATFFTNFTWRKLGAVAGGLTAVVLFALLLENMFGFEGFLSLDFISDYADSDKGYTGRGDINRLNAIATINEEWLKSGWQRLFGLGLGNCDSAGFEFLVTPFFETYGNMHYTWFYYAFLYLETGWIGLALYWGFFVLAFFEIWKIEKRSEGVTKSYCRMGRILSICCVVLSVYNIGLRTEGAYMMFFALAVPFALDRENRKKRVTV